jgi:hypothetical protein
MFALIHRLPNPGALALSYLRALCATLAGARGSAKVLAVATWSGLTCNLMRAIRMGWL